MRLEQTSPYTWVAILPQYMGKPTLRVRNTPIPIKRHRYQFENTMEQQLYNRTTFVADLNLEHSGMLNPNQPVGGHYRLEMETERPIAEEEQLEVFFTQQPLGIV